MSVYRGISRSASQPPIVVLRDVLLEFGVPEALGKAKVYQIHLGLLGCSEANAEIFRLQIPVNVVFLVEIFDPP